MTELLKDRYNAQFLSSLCEKLSEQYAEFDHSGFSAAVFDESWEEKELKQRMGHIAVCLDAFLPMKYEAALEILKPVSSHFSGFEPMIFPDFVERFGQKEYLLSVNALAHFTQFSSSEFAVRPFIINDLERMMKQMADWAASDNHHVRRLASEGCRPRLPWAMALPDFKKDPSAILPILERLKNDPSEYVRRSVANNLNDIAKDNPDVVLGVATRWLGETENTDKLVKHACRTLLKKGEPKAMMLFGYAPPVNLSLMHFSLDEVVKMGEMLSFSFELKSENSLGKIRIEFAVHFVKSNKSLSKKVFKIGEGNFSGNKKSIKKTFSFSPISTRKYYTGEHRLEIIVNGVSLAEKGFVLSH